SDVCSSDLSDGGCPAPSIVVLPYATLLITTAVIPRCRSTPFCTLIQRIYRLALSCPVPPGTLLFLFHCEISKRFCTLGPTMISKWVGSGAFDSVFSR